MPLVLLKLGLTPLLIGGTTLAARRWGPAVAGLLISLPLTSGPVLFFLALDHGGAFAAAASQGSLGGMLALGAFCLGYAWAAGSTPWPAALAAACAGFVAISLAVQPLLGGPVGVLLAVVVVGLLAVVRLMPRGAGMPVPVVPPWWDIPARMLVGTGVVVALTEVAPLLGPHLSGQVAIFPVIITVLTVFSHRHAGPLPAIDGLRGLVLGLFGTAAFYVVLVVGLSAVGVALAFAAALAVTLALQGMALALLRVDRAGTLGA